MKILNLLEIIDTKNINAEYSGSLRSPIVRRGGAKALGYGGFSVVRQNKKDPHTVIKNNTSPLGATGLVDGYEKFALLVAERKLYENPHFPRIYVVKKIVDKNGNHINKYEIEKLLKIDDIPEDEIRTMNAIYFNVHENDLRSLNPMDILEIYIDDAIYGHEESRIKDEILLQAIKTIRDINDEFNKSYIPNNEKLMLDVGLNNMMIRRGPHGPQLVFTDPFA